jgi:hypothetical protein
MNAQHRVSALLITAATGLFGSVAVAAPPAYASCAHPARPSEHAFVGQVIATELDDRVATVRTAGGDTVQVVGTPSPEDNSLTSVDRKYVAGATYEFHPWNDTDPYEDNVCSATERLRGDEVPAVLRHPVMGEEAEAPSASGDGIAAAGLLGVAVLGLSGAGLWWRRCGATAGL